MENALAFRDSELKNKLAQEKLYLEEEIRSEMDFEQIVGRSPALRHVLELVKLLRRPIPRCCYWARQGPGKS